MLLCFSGIRRKLCGVSLSLCIYQTGKAHKGFHSFHLGIRIQKTIIAITACSRWLWETKAIICVQAKFLSNPYNPLWKSIWPPEQKKMSKRSGIKGKNQNSSKWAGSESCAVDMHVARRTHLQSLQCPSDQTRGFEFRKNTALPWGRPCFPQRQTVWHYCMPVSFWMPADLSFTIVEDDTWEDVVDVMRWWGFIHGKNLIKSSF